MVDPNIHMRDATHENVNGDCKVTFAEKNTKKMVSLLELEKVEVITMPLPALKRFQKLRMKRMSQSLIVMMHVRISLLVRRTKMLCLAT